MTFFILHFFLNLDWCLNFYAKKSGHCLIPLQPIKNLFLIGLQTDPSMAVFLFMPVTILREHINNCKSPQKKLDYLCDFN